MKLWLDAQLSPYLADWISREFDIECLPVRNINLRDANDAEIFEQAIKKHAIVMTKDSDFAHLAKQKEQSPNIIWITVGNSSNHAMKKLLRQTLPSALDMIDSGENLVEITDDWSIT